MGYIANFRVIFSLQQQQHSLPSAALPRAATAAGNPSRWFAAWSATGRLASTSFGALSERVVLQPFVHTLRWSGSISRSQAPLFVKVGGRCFFLQRGTFARCRRQRNGYERQKHPGLYRGGGAQDRHSNNPPRLNFCPHMRPGVRLRRLPTPHPARHRAQPSAASRLGAPGRSPSQRAMPHLFDRDGGVLSRPLLTILPATVRAPSVHALTGSLCVAALLPQGPSSTTSSTEGAPIPPAPWHDTT